MSIGLESILCLHFIKRKWEVHWLTQFGNSWAKISDRESVLLRLAVISNRFDRRGMVPVHMSRRRLLGTWPRLLDLLSSRCYSGVGLLSPFCCHFGIFILL